MLEYTIASVRVLSPVAIFRRTQPEFQLSLLSVRQYDEPG